MPSLDPPSLGPTRAARHRTTGASGGPSSVAPLKRLNVSIVSSPPERPDLDRPRLGDRVPGRDLDGLLQTAALDDVEPAERLLGLGERTVGDDRLPVTDADRARPARRSQLVAGDPAAPRLELVQPGKALLVRSLSRSGLGLGVHPLGVPAD